MKSELLLTSAFRKNIIAFPQELAEVKQILNFWTSAVVGDLVNVNPPDGLVTDVTAWPRRARIVALLDGNGFTVTYANGVDEQIPYQRVRQRVVLPWKPREIREHFVVLRRRNARREDYVEDLQVRRSLLGRIA